MNFGAVGTSFIMKTMLTEFAKCDGLRCTAICSRKEETGRAVADQFGIEKVYTCLDAMLADPTIEMVYIATPNSLHFAQAKASLLAGKHVLCEKPFTPTLAEARELAALAKEKHLLLFEAIITAHHPHYALIRENLSKLGTLRMMLGTFCQFSSKYPAFLEGNVYPIMDPAFKGGALMDINLYNIHFAVGLFGSPKALHYYPNCRENGIDTSGVLILEYDGFLCQCVGAKDCATENGVQIAGEAGYIHATPSASNPQKLEICIRGQEPVVAALPEIGWHYEVQQLSRLFSSLDYDACYAALETTLNVVDVLEKARKDAGLCF